ncbi:hypothetical protein BaRGS_00021092 [Batillaria attramentaria]|uniref:AIG1-type G domain-containing protein n=1 Tax=Batillaria attramentaria TaxID=370345 RepID=A0ABD0KKE1_9CAEN
MSRAGLTSSPQHNYETLAEESKVIRILVIGKTGNGKSSVCNTILGEDKFATGRSMASTTKEVQVAETEKDGDRIKVIDTPDVTNCEMDEQQMQAEVSRWRSLTSPCPDIVLLAIRCDVRYTKEEYDIYSQIKSLWGDGLRERLVVAFTFGDRQDQPIENELKTVCPELKRVLKDARQRYVVFNQTDTPEGRAKTVKKVLELARGSRPGHILPLLVITLVLVGLVCILLVVLYSLCGCKPVKLAAIIIGIVGMVYGVVVFALVLAVYWIPYPFITKLIRL